MEGYSGVENVPSFIQLPRIYWDGELWRGPTLVTVRTTDILNYQPFEPRGEKQKVVTSFPVTKIYLRDLSGEDSGVRGGPIRPREVILWTVQLHTSQLDLALQPITF